MSTEVNIAGYDIFDLGYVESLPNITEKKTFQKDKLICNSYDIPVNNKDDFFSINNSKSIFNNIDWLYTPIEIKKDGEIRWLGELIKILRNHNNKTAILKTKNSLFKFRKDKILYSSSTWETGADAFKNICDNYGFTNYNKKAVQDSINQLTANSCFLKVNITQSDNVTFQQIIEKLGEYSNADVYSHLNDVYFVHWQPFSGGVKVELIEEDLKTLPTVEEDEKDLINDYRIGYDGDAGTPATDSNSGIIGNVSRSKFGTQSLPEMRSDTRRQIVYETKAAAIYIGEGYINRVHKNLSTQPDPLTFQRFDLFADQRQWIDLNTYFKLTLSDESWTEKIFEIFEFTINEEEDNINLLAYEVIQ